MDAEAVADGQTVDIAGLREWCLDTGFEHFVEREVDVPFGQVAAEEGGRPQLGYATQAWRHGRFLGGCSGNGIPLGMIWPARGVLRWGA
jgi:hypothetical protein